MTWYQKNQLRVKQMQVSLGTDKFDNMDISWEGE